MSGVPEIFVGLLAAIAVLALDARRVTIPYPILFVLGGVLLALVPGLPRVRLHPDVVFLFILPALLYPAALFTSWRDFRANLRPISLLAIGLALFTTIAVAYLAHYYMDLPLAAGFVLGAIIPPPDAIATAAIAEQLSVPRRIITILEGESLVNDATALVALRSDVVAMVTGSFSLASATGPFFVVAIGGSLTGLAVGWLAEKFHRRVDDAPVEITVSLLVPFVACLMAERLGVSGVLAVVTAGLYMGMRAPELVSFKPRLRAGPAWEMLEFLPNGFVLIGLQLPEVLRVLAGNSIPVQKLVWYALLISVAIIVIRMLWVFPATYLPRLVLKRLCRHEHCPPWQHTMVIAWTGMRGVVSLAAALALPLALQSGAPFPDRELILFLTFVVMVATLVLQGLSLPPLIRWFGIRDDRSMEKEERDARLEANRAALARLNEVAESDPAEADTLQRLRIEHEGHIRQVEGAETQSAGAPLRLFSSEYARLSYEALRVERMTIIKLRDTDAIGYDVLRRIQRDIDLAEARLHYHQWPCPQSFAKNLSCTNETPAAPFRPFAVSTADLRASASGVRPAGASPGPAIPDRHESPLSDWH